MWEVHVESLAVTDGALRAGIFVLWLRLVLLLRTFSDDQLMAALMNHAGANCNREQQVTFVCSSLTNCATIKR